MAPANKLLNISKGGPDGGSGVGQEQDMSFDRQP